MNEFYLAKNSIRACSSGLLCLALSFTTHSSSQADVVDQDIEYICGIDPENICVMSSEDVNPSYALGIKFQREVGSEYSQLDYAYFLKGVFDAKKTKVTLSNNEIDAQLANAILTEADQSKSYLKEFAGKPNVVGLDGIFVVKKSPHAKFLDDVECDVGDLENGSFEVRFTRLKLSDTAPVKWPDQVSSDLCVSVEESQMIRGWRTALNAMNPDDKWEVVIPPELGYGSKGVSGLVTPDVAMRFVLHLVRK